MAFEHIIERIIKDAEKESQDIKQKAQNEVEKINLRFKRERDNFLEKALKEAQKKAEEEKQKIVVLERLNLRKKELSEKREIINRVFEQAFYEISHLPDQRYLDLLKKMLLKSVETGDELCVISEKDSSRITPGFFEEVNQKLREMGKKGEIKLADEKGVFESGFILKRGKIEYNNSFEVLFKKAKENLIEMVKETLFP